VTRRRFTDAMLCIGPRRPGLTLGLTLALTALSILAVSRLRPDASVGSLLGRANPAASVLADILDRFSVGDDLLVLASFPGDSGPPSADDRAAALRDFALRLADRLAPGLNQRQDARAAVRAVATAPPPSLAEYATRELVPAGAYFLADEDLDALLARLSRHQMDAQLSQNEAMLAAPGPAALAEALIRDPLRIREFLAPRLAALAPPMRTLRSGQEFISPDARSILIRVTGAGAPGDLDAARRLTSLVDRAARQAGPGPLTIELTGTPAIAALSERAVKGDLISSIAWSVSLMGALFLIMYRSPAAFPLAIFPVAVGILGAFAVHSLFSLALTPLTAVIAAMLAGLGSDYGVHLMSHVEHDRGAGDGPRAAPERAVRALAAPLFIACLTSIAGFIALLTSELPALRDFAGVGCLGLLLVLGATLATLPALLVILPARFAGIGLVGARFSFAPVAALTWKHRHACLAIALALTASLVFTVFRPGPFSWIEDDLRVMHPSPNAALDAQRRAAAAFGVSPGTLLVHLCAADDDHLAALSHRAAEALQSPGAKSVGVAGVLGPHSLIPDPARTSEIRARLRAIDSARVERDFRDALAASSFEPSRFEGYITFLRSLLGESPAPTLDTLRRYPAVADTFLATMPAGARSSEAIVSVLFTRDLDQRESRAAVIEALRTLLADLPGATLTGLPVLAHDAESVIRRDLPRVLSIGLALVIVLLWLFFRSAMDVALALLPFAFGVLCMLAWMRASGTPFNMVNQMALPILCGLGVDFGIFLVSTTRHARAEDADTPETVRRLGASLHAVFMSTAPNVLAVGALTATSVPAIQSLGNCLAVGLLGAWLGAQLIVAPAAIARSARSRSA